MSVTSVKRLCPATSEFIEQLASILDSALTTVSVSFPTTFTSRTYRVWRSTNVAL